MRGAMLKFVKLVSSSAFIVIFLLANKYAVALDDCRGKALLPPLVEAPSPDDDMTKENAHLLGLWSGKRGGTRCHLLLIQSIDKSGVIVAIFGYGQWGRNPAGYRMVFGKLRKGKLDFDLGSDRRGNYDKRLVLTPEKDFLKGAWRKDVQVREGSSNDRFTITKRIIMERVSVPSLSR